MTGARIRVLAAAFAAVPSSTPHGAAMLSMIDGLRCDLDLVTVKTEDLSHIKRIGEARMFRVPVLSASVPEQRDIYSRAVARQIEAEPYDVVHVLDPWAGAVAAERCRTRGFRLVYEICTFPDPDRDEQRSWLEAHERTLEAADRVLVTTLATARTLEKRGLRDRVEVVRPGVDIGRFDWEEHPPFGTPRLLYVGPYSQFRDLPTVLEAIAKVTSLRPIRALFVGERDPIRRADLRELVKKAGLSDVIEVRGEPAPRALPQIITAADICLAPARLFEVAGCTELPQPLVEHMACYRAVVAADTPGVSEILRDDVEGLLYPPGDASAMADAVLEILRDSVLRERITDAAYRKVRDVLHSGTRRRRIREIYELVAPGSQSFDPWTATFEDVTGLIELSTNVLDELRDDSPETVPPPGPNATGTDTDETRVPGERRGERTRALVQTLQSELAPPSTDTHPGLVVPDTDPGRH